MEDPLRKFRGSFVYFLESISSKCSHFLTPRQKHQKTCSILVFLGFIKWDISRKPVKHLLSRNPSSHDLSGVNSLEQCFGFAVEKM